LPPILSDRKSLRYRLQQRLVRCRRSQDVDRSPVQKPVAMFGMFAPKIREREPVKKRRASDRYFSLRLIPHFRLWASIESHEPCSHPFKAAFAEWLHTGSCTETPLNLSMASRWQNGRWPSVSDMCCIARQQLRGLCLANANVTECWAAFRFSLFNILSS
jgi:hypothetical protein